MQSDVRFAPLTNLTRRSSRMYSRSQISCTAFNGLILAFALCAPGIAQVVTFPNPPGLATSADFTMQVNGTNVWVEKAGAAQSGGTYYDQLEALNVASFGGEGQLSVTITASANITSCIIRPKSAGITGQVNGRTLTFTTTGPRKLYIEINSLAHLLVLANPIEVNPPKQGDPGVQYFGPGAYSSIQLASNTTYYIAGGAVINARISASNLQNVKILGRGVLNGNVRISNSSNIEINGIFIRNTSGWTNTLTNCDHLRYVNVKVYSYSGYNGVDGIDPVSCRYVTIDDCFVRARDDCIAIKSTNYGQPADSISVVNSMMCGWSSSDGVTLGYELNANVSNVLVKNCDIIYARGSGATAGHSGFSVICDGPAVVQGIRFEDIRVEEQIEFKNLEFVTTNGTMWGNDPPGHIKGVYLKNVRWENAGKPFVMNGFSDTNLVENITFDNCWMGSRPMKSTADAMFQIGANVKNVTFVNSPGPFAAVAVYPSIGAVKPGQTQRFTAQAVDQSGQPVATQPAAFTWSISGGGVISSSGVYTAAGVVGGPFVVTANATAGGVIKSGIAKVYITDTLMPGLAYALYQGAWTYLPDFGALTPSKTGITATFTNGVASPLTENYAITFIGMISIPVDGQYVFYTASNDGSQLFIDNQQAALVNNDGEHGPIEVADTIQLSAGMHLIEVTYFQHLTGRLLTVSWSGPGITKQAIPANVLFLLPKTAVNAVRPAHSAAVPAASTMTVCATSGGFFLKMCGSSPYSILISDLSGSVVRRFSGAGTAYEIKFGELTNGAYLVAGQVGAHRIVQRIVAK